MSLFGGKRILVFGDSLSHPGSDTGPAVAEYGGPITSSAPGAVLAGKLMVSGAGAARTDARVGRSAVNFWSREDYKTLLDNDVAWRPDLVVVMLGTNDLGLSAGPDALAMAGIRDTFRQAGAEVWAVGPPSFIAAENMARTQSVVDTMKKVFGADKFIDLRPLTIDLTATGRTKDGVHFTPAGAEAVADRLVDVLSKTGGLSIGSGIALGLALFFSAIFAGVIWTRR